MIGLVEELPMKRMQVGLEFVIEGQHIVTEPLATLRLPRRQPKVLESNYLRIKISKSPHLFFTLHSSLFTFHPSDFPRCCRIHGGQKNAAHQG